MTRLKRILLLVVFIGSPLCYSPQQALADLPDHYFATELSSPGVKWWDQSMLRLTSATESIDKSLKSADNPLNSDDAANGMHELSMMLLATNRLMAGTTVPSGWDHVNVLLGSSMNSYIKWLAQRAKYAAGDPQTEGMMSGYMRDAHDSLKQAYQEAQAKAELDGQASRIHPLKDYVAALLPHLNDVSPADVEMICHSLANVHHRLVLIHSREDLAVQRSMTARGCPLPW